MEERYYWEVVLISRKVLIIASAVFLSTVSPESQVLVNLLILAVSLMVHSQLQPYYTRTLNSMETYSLIVAIITMYAGMFYVTGRWYDYMNKYGLKWFFFFTIVIPNILFLAYWLYYMGIELIKVLIDKK